MLHNFVSDKTVEEILLDSACLGLLRFTNNTVLPSHLDKAIPSLKLELIQSQQAQAQQDESQPSSKSSALYEVWQAPGENFKSGENGDIFWRASQNLQLCSITAPLLARDDAEQITEQLYNQLLAFIEQSQHKQIVRFWNYLPHINYGAGDKENYKRFCTGRLRAFANNGIANAQFPAASAVGHFKEGITIYALTCSKTVSHFSNPRQVDAFKYPRQYGPSSPSFARASTVEINNSKLCFISGTASILGHETVHEGDLELQLKTIKNNIHFLIEEAKFNTQDIKTLRIYLRHKNDFMTCEKIVSKHYPGATTIYTHADICRSDLLVEIECFCISS